MVSLPESVQQQLAADDDPAFWIAALRATADHALALQPGSRRSILFADVGRCSHWLRPHQTRWTAGGGFAAPLGYGKGKSFLRGAPEFDWSVSLQFDPEQSAWVMPLQDPDKRSRVVRLVLPARTMRHRQAAVHAVWPRGTVDRGEGRVAFYGFRKSEEGWRLVGCSRE